MEDEAEVEQASSLEAISQKRSFLNPVIFFFFFFIVVCVCADVHVSPQKCVIIVVVVPLLASILHWWCIFLFH